MMRHFVIRVAVVVMCLAIGLVPAARNCPRCGFSNPDNARFCGNCGFELPRPEPRPRPRPEPLPTLRASVIPEPGGAFIGSTPEGATVVVDGIQRGVTPVRVTGLVPGRYEYQLTLTGYRDHSGSFMVPRPQGVIRVITSPPGAEVLLDERGIGTAPDTGLLITDLDPGEYLVGARMTGRLEQARTVVLDESRMTAVITLEIPSADGFLSVHSEPRGAFLSINGERTGRTSYFGALRPNRYRLELEAEGFRRWRDNVTVRLGDTTSIHATLRPVRERRWGLLALGLAGVAGGAAGAVLGQAAYDEYLTARPPDYKPDDIANLRRRTVLLDWARNVGGGLGVLSLGAFLVF